MFRSFTENLRKKRTAERLSNIQYHSERHEDALSGIMDIAYRMPLPCETLTLSERNERMRLSDDLCVLDQEHFFIRGVLRLPIVDSNEYLGFGLWVSTSEEDFLSYAHAFSDTSPDLGPHFGLLANGILGMDGTMGLKCQLQYQELNQRPLVALAPSDHPLVISQMIGISIDQMFDIYKAHGYEVDDR